MTNEKVRQGDFFQNEVIDLDQIVTEAESLRGVKGTTDVRLERSRRMWLKPVGKVIRPSFGGKIEAQQTMLFEDGQEKFKCGR